MECFSSVEHCLYCTSSLNKLYLWLLFFYFTFNCQLIWFTGIGILEARLFRVYNNHICINKKTPIQNEEEKTKKKTKKNSLHTTKTKLILQSLICSKRDFVRPLIGSWTCDKHFIYLVLFVILYKFYTRDYYENVQIEHKLKIGLYYKATHTKSPNLKQIDDAILNLNVGAFHICAFAHVFVSHSSGIPFTECLSVYTYVRLLVRTYVHMDLLCTQISCKPYCRRWAVYVEF